jgi:hypothetical protein
LIVLCDERPFVECELIHRINKKTGFTGIRSDL